MSRRWGTGFESAFEGAPIHSDDVGLGAMHLTTFTGRLDPQTGDLRHVSAGHLVPYLAGGGLHVARFGDVTGPILGILGAGGFAELRLATCRPVSA